MKKLLIGLVVAAIGFAIAAVICYRNDAGICTIINSLLSCYLALWCIVILLAKAIAKEEAEEEFERQMQQVKQVKYYKTATYSPANLELLTEYEFDAAHCERIDR